MHFITYCIRVLIIVENWDIQKLKQILFLLQVKNIIPLLGIIRTISIYILYVPYNYIHTILRAQKIEICNICMTEIAR